MEARVDASRFRARLPQCIICKEVRSPGEAQRNPGRAVENPGFRCASPGLQEKKSPLLLLLGFLHRLLQRGLHAGLHRHLALLPRAAAQRLLRRGNALAQLDDDLLGLVDGLFGGADVAALRRLVGGFLRLATFR